ncbi:hypothetical protein DFH08DRAFT_815036 [Mycena albidolilacea]|uniref:Uncharacterized protein n=1 Tax=Mycena albidolilacea TaxID=1033008 RepID=A0AAD6ZNA8_9AGAR|nr:hypothetical protein DFH08DRAFT_815036 [Mycena albidolilacea]
MPKYTVNFAKFDSRWCFMISMAAHMAVSVYVSLFLLSPHTLSLRRSAGTTLPIVASCTIAIVGSMQITLDVVAATLAARMLHEVAHSGNRADRGLAALGRAQRSAFAINYATYAINVEWVAFQGGFYIFPYPATVSRILCFTTTFTINSSIPCILAAATNLVLPALAGIFFFCRCVTLKWLTSRSDPIVMRVVPIMAQVFIRNLKTSRSSILPKGWVVVCTNFNSTVAWGTLYVKVGEGIPADVDGFSEPIPLHAGSHLSAILSITGRRIFSTAMDLLGLVTPTSSIILRPVLLLQEEKTPPNFGSDTVSLRLRPRTGFISSANVVQDYPDAFILNSIATFGEFWIFMDGAFAILFGANILYFLYGSRPLSPLGFIDFFRCRTPIRRWSEDIPAFRTEGGQPGTENAGIVAFMRKWFMDIPSESPKTKDVESQHLPEDVTQVKEMQEKGNGVSSSGLGAEKDGDVQHCHCELGEEKGGLESGFVYLAGVA